MCIFLFLATVFHSCKKADTRPVYIGKLSRSSQLKKVVYTRGDSLRLTVDFAYYADGRVRQAHKVISRMGASDTIIDLKYTYTASGHTIESSIITPSGVTTGTESFIYQSGRILEYQDPAGMRYRFYYDDDASADYILTNIGDSIDVVSPVPDAIHLSEAPYNSTCIYPYVKYSEGMRALEYDPGNSNCLVDEYSDLFYFSTLANPFQKEVWDTFGPKPEMGRLYQLLLQGIESESLPFERRSNPHNQFWDMDTDWYYEYFMDEFGRIKFINVTKALVIADGFGKPNILNPILQRLHNYTFFY